MGSNDLEVPVNKNDALSVNEIEVRNENKLDDNLETITPKMIDDNELKLKERIAQCKNIITSLKLELNEEKTKLEKEVEENRLQSNEQPAKLTSNINNDCTLDNWTGLYYNSNMYASCVDSKLNCDENLMEYEKQLQRYQNTLNMAQIEKKNAIRKQMLAKAFKLKLMEVENQCNIELLRIKQSLQCLEPLQIIAEKWKTTNKDDLCDLNNFELIPIYPELTATSGSDITNMSSRNDSENKLDILNLEKRLS